MSKLYLITAKSNDYDEYDSVLIRAKSKEQAEHLLKKHISNYWCSEEDWSLKNFENYGIEEVKQSGESKVIIASFNAG